MRTRESVEAVIKAYDVRGVVGEDGFDADFMRETGAAFGRLMRTEGARVVAVGHDMREIGRAHV